MTPQMRTPPGGSTPDGDLHEQTYRRDERPGNDVQGSPRSKAAAVR